MDVVLFIQMMNVVLFIHPYKQYYVVKCYRKLNPCIQICALKKYH